VQEYAAPIPTSTAGEVRRGSTLIVAHRAALRAEVERHREFWRGLGVDPLTSPEEVLRAVEQAPRADRWRGYGYVFGYPQTAVDFFVSAGLRGDSLDTLIPRDFRRIETYRKFPGRSGAPPTESSFVYAVAKDAPESPVDSALRNAAAPIFADYLRIRPDSMVPIETVLRNWSRVVNHSYPGSANARSR